MDAGERAAVLAEVECANLIAMRAAELSRELDTVGHRLNYLEAFVLPLAIYAGEGCDGRWSVG